MSDDELALLRAVEAYPDDDLPRLVYADWLDEQGRHTRAEFIRFHCGLARILLNRRMPGATDEERIAVSAALEMHLACYSGVSYRAANAVEIISLPQGETIDR